MSRRSLTLAFLLLPVLAMAEYGQERVDEILQMDPAPPGVVFEVVGWDEDELGDVLAAVRAHAERLRARFPGIGIAVVSHGLEQFALVADERENYPQAHAQVRELVQNDNVPVHVCGTFADWNGVSRDAFPDYVDVADAGPTQVFLYQDQGYLLVELNE